MDMRRQIVRARHRIIGHPMSLDQYQSSTDVAWGRRQTRRRLRRLGFVILVVLVSSSWTYGIRFTVDWGMLIGTDEWQRLPLIVFVFFGVTGFLRVDSIWVYLCPSGYLSARIRLARRELLARGHHDRHALQLALRRLKGVRRPWLESSYTALKSEAGFDRRAMENYFSLWAFVYPGHSILDRLCHELEHYYHDISRGRNELIMESRGLLTRDEIRQIEYEVRCNSDPRSWLCNPISCSICWIERQSYRGERAWILFLMMSLATLSCFYWYWM